MGIDRLKLRTKLVLLIGLSALAFIASNMLGASTLRQRMIDDRLDKLLAVAEVVTSQWDALQANVLAGRMTTDQMLAEIRDGVHAIRFDDKVNYLALQKTDGTVLAHGTKPALEGKPTVGRDVATGKTTSQIALEALGERDSAIISFSFPAAENAPPKLKTGYVHRFRPLDAVLVVSAFTDDLDNDFLAHCNAISGSIAAAVEQQGASTAEIARNIGQTAEAAEEMTRQTAGAAAGAQQADQRATQLRDDMDALNTGMAGLSQAVVRAVRSAS